MTAAPLSTTIERCRVCDSAEIEIVLDLGRQPLANSLRRDVKERLPTFPLVLCRCAKCGTVQLTETVAPEVLFAHYVWVTGTSEGARSYSKVFRDRMLERVGPGKKFILEVASNDGTFLRSFAEKDHRVLGVDPAANIAAMAEQSGVPTIAEFFGLGVARRVVAEQGLADVVFARNVIPHVANARDVIAGMAHCLSDQGVAAIEFHTADVILRELHYDSIYHEHLYYHSLHSVARLVEPFGLRPFDVATSPISGGSLVVYLSKQSRPATAALTMAMEREDAIGVARAEPWREFARRSTAHASELRGCVEQARKRGDRIIGYGASARSSTMLNFCGIDHTLLDVVVDRSPLKHDRFTPGTNIPIVSPEKGFTGKVDTVLLLAWNFRDEILAQIRAERGWKGNVIVPLPGAPSVSAVA